MFTAKISLILNIIHVLRTFGANSRILKIILSFQDHEKTIENYQEYRYCPYWAHTRHIDIPSCIF